MVIRIEHNELELHVISDIWNPFTVFLSIDINIVLNLNLTFVILWVVKSVRLITGFVVSYVIGS